MANHLVTLLKLYPDKLWNWQRLSCNLNITWEFVQAHLDWLWDWKWLSKNPNITWEIIHKSNRIGKGYLGTILVRNKLFLHYFLGSNVIYWKGRPGPVKRAPPKAPIPPPSRAPPTPPPSKPPTAAPPSPPIKALRP